MNTISASEARSLLDVCPPWDHVKIAQTVDLDHGPDRAVLAASAHALAETVVWLYTPDGPPDGHDVHARAGAVWLDSIDHTPDEAVDLALALLAAAKEARAEAAGARTAPTVTRKLVYDAVGAVYDVNGHRGPWPGVEPITDAVCHLFGIETAPDPVETLAVQIEDATRRAVRQACETLAPVAAGLNPEVIEEMMDITEASRRLARHVLGKEARDGVDR